MDEFRTVPRLTEWVGGVTVPNIALGCNGFQFVSKANTLDGELKAIGHLLTPLIVSLGIFLHVGMND